MMTKLNIYKQHKNNYVDKTYCKGCEAEEDMHRPIDQHWWARRDAYGNFTGIYCDDCFESGELGFGGFIGVRDSVRKGLRETLYPYIIFYFTFFIIRN